MTRPAVIIGVGGTGQWVLTYLKKDLLEEGNGQLPSNVRFLAFDTMPQSEVRLGVSEGKEQEIIEVGSVKLDAREFIHVGGDAYRLGEAILQDKQNQNYPQVRKWFQVDFWWKALPPAAWILDEGAGRIRQMGRLAVFKDIMGGIPSSLIWRSLKNAVDAVRSSVNEETRLEIIIVGSFAGGTGSGMFSDIALILRKMATNIPHVLRGYFALPSVFGAKLSDEMWARTFAAWRELNRLMVVDVDFPMRVDYIADEADFQVLCDKRLFDACYLVGGRRGGQPITVDAKFSVFPALAESISAILDDEAGTAYTRYVWQNLAPAYAAKAGMPLYSTIGAYTLKVPAYYKQQMASHNFSMNVLSVLLQPRDWTAKGGNRLALLSPPDANLEKGKGVPGRKEAETFLSRDVISFQRRGVDSEIVRPTLFTAKIQRIANASVSDFEVMVGEHAAAVLKERRRDIEDPSWLMPFTDLGEDPDFENLRQEVGDEISINLIRAYGPRPKEKPEESGKRIVGSERDIKDFVFEHYGGETTRGEEVHGKFGEVLQKCSDFQTQLFRRMVRLWLLDTLTGRSENLVIARGGKLGYAYDFLDGLIANLDKNRVFMEAVAARREKEKPRLTLEGLSKNAQAIMHKNTDKKFLWFFDHPDAKRSQQYYLYALQRIIDLRKEEILHLFVSQTIQTLKEICINARDEVARWIWHLATGDDPTNLPGLYSDIKQSQEIVSGDYKVDEDIARAAFQELIAAKPDEADEAELARVLSWWEWDGKIQGNALQLNVTLKPEGREESSLEAVWRAEGERRRVLAEANRRAFLKMTGLHFQGSAQRTEIARELAAGQLYPEAKNLADHIGGRAEPLFWGVPGSKARPARKSNIIRVGYRRGDGRVQGYFVNADGLQGQLRAAAQLPLDKPDDAYLITVENSSNPYKITVVRTDDLYPHDAFQEWEDCRLAYSKFLFEAKGHNNPRLLHNFASEINASDYEKRMGAEGEFRPLHPKVVMLLEERDKFELAIDCLLTGIIRYSREDSSWRLRSQYGKKAVEIWLTSPFKQATGGDQEAPDLFHALYGFLIVGRDRRLGYSQFRIEYNKVRDLVEDRQKSAWADKTEDILEHHLNEPTGMVMRLESLAQDDFDNVIKPEYVDLARLVKLLLENRLGKLKHPGVATDTGLPWDILDFGETSPTAREQQIAAVEPDFLETEPEDPDKLSW